MVSEGSAFNEQLVQDIEVAVVGVEQDIMSYQWLHQHLLLNMRAQDQLYLFQGFIDC